MIKLILQFLKENALDETMKVLQQESQVSLNAVDDMERFKSDITHGSMFDFNVSTYCACAHRTSPCLNVHHDSYLEIDYSVFAFKPPFFSTFPTIS